MDPDRQLNPDFYVFVGELTGTVKVLKARHKLDDTDIEAALEILFENWSKRAEEARNLDVQRLLRIGANAAAGPEP